MADPLSKLNTLVSRQKTIIKTQKATAKIIREKKALASQVGTASPIRPVVPPPNVSDGNDVSE